MGEPGIDFVLFTCRGDKQLLGQCPWIELVDGFPLARRGRVEAGFELHVAKDRPATMGYLAVTSRAAIDNHGRGLWKVYAQGEQVERPVSTPVWWVLVVFHRVGGYDEV